MLLVALLAIGLLQGSSTPVEQARERGPNIVLVLADDLGIGDPGCYNPASKIPTPHIDRLAAEGLRLTDCHTPSAVCTPTRYGILTGRYAWRTRLTSGVLWGRSPNLIEPERLTLAEALRERGYRTGCFGKWHLGLGDREGPDWTAPLHPGPLDHGFDAFFGIPASLDMDPYVYVLGDRAVQAPTAAAEHSAHRRQGGGGFWRGGPAAPDFRHVEVLPRVVARAVEFVERATREAPSEPFFLYVPLTAPHTPWLPTEAWRGVSEAGHYGDFVAQVDDAVGQVLAALERMGVADDTLVLVTSDNGSHWPAADIERFGHAANLAYRGQKADIWEGGHRVPFVARWPGHVEAGAVRGDLIGLTDLFATLVALTGGELPADAAEDSLDQRALLFGDGTAPPARTSIVHHSLDGLFALRAGDWKLVLGLGSGGFTQPARVAPTPDDPRGQLYDLGSDPGETRNRWSERATKVAELEALLEQIRSSGRSRP